MFVLFAIWSTRYLDMLLPRPSPRQRIVTLRACVEKNIAAWPAELPGADDVHVEAVRVGRLAA